MQNFIDYFRECVMLVGTPSGLIEQDAVHVEVKPRRFR
jgi:hypothetical protein